MVIVARHSEKNFSEFWTLPFSRHSHPSQIVRVPRENRTLGECGQFSKKIRILSVRDIEENIICRPGGTRLSCGRGGGGDAAGGRKPDPVANRSVHKKYTLSQYTLLKKIICIPCRNIAPSLGPRSRACHKHCGLGTPGKQPCDKRSSPPVAN